MIEWGAIAVGAIVGYRLVRRKIRRYREENSPEEEYRTEDREEEREYRVNREEPVRRSFQENMEEEMAKPQVRVSDSERREINEAIRAGERALDSLHEAKGKLDSARAWGIYDILGGGIISSAVKHHKMSDANEWVDRANDDLRRFAKELRDIPGEELYVQTGDLASTLDIFFDNIFSDFIVQNRINEAREEIDRLIDRVQETVWGLKEKAAEM